MSYQLRIQNCIKNTMRNLKNNNNIGRTSSSSSQNQIHIGDFELEDQNHFRKPSLEPSEDQKLNKCQLIQQTFGSILIKFVQLFGFLPLQLNGNSGLTVTWKCLPFWITITAQSFFLFWAILIWTCWREFNQIVEEEGTGDVIEIFSMTLSGMFTAFCIFCVQTINLVKRKDISRHFNELHQGIYEIIERGQKFPAKFPLQDHQIVLDSDQDIKNRDDLLKLKKFTRNFIFQILACFIWCGVFHFWLGHGPMQPFVIMQTKIKSKIKSMILYLGMNITNMGFTSHNLFILWLIYLLRLKVIYLAVLQRTIETIVQNFGPASNQNDIILDIVQLEEITFRKIEYIVKEFSVKIYFPQIMISIVSSVNIILSITFFIILWIQSASANDYVNLLIYGPCVIVNILGMFYLCSAGTDITAKATEISKMWKSFKKGPYRQHNSVEIGNSYGKYENLELLKINVGNFFVMNRKLLTSVLGQLITYIVILLQFKNQNQNSKEKLK